MAGVAWVEYLPNVAHGWTSFAKTEHEMYTWWDYLDVPILVIYVVHGEGELEDICLCMIESKLSVMHMH